MTNELLDAIAPGDVEVWKRYTDDGLIYYRLTPEIVTKVSCTAGGLSSERTGRKAVTMKAEVRDVFFEPGQPRTRRYFLRDERGTITGFADRREGLDIRWVKVE